MKTHLVRKWSFRKVDRALDAILSDLRKKNSTSKIGYTVYYAGGTLCIDFDYHPSVCLNTNGRGFFYNFKYPAALKEASNAPDEVKFVVTNSMRVKVLEIYQLVKGPNSKKAVEEDILSVNV
jgi:hypothetical protein